LILSGQPTITSNKASILIMWGITTTKQWPYLVTVISETCRVH
jgi:hypothetical protein